MEKMKIKINDRIEVNGWIGSVVYLVALFVVWNENGLFVYFIQYIFVVIMLHLAAYRITFKNL